ncbi:GFA family protein [Chelativorans xinjiangense]|uniref:GFA family protein n=1 Tax=Chelativorans xinjiangense TaxID=2681485 RepID=UPI00135B94AF|nr:GFA family protein [Chelativorans xinjiangense]
MTSAGPDGVRRLAGRCLCGAVHYTVDDAFGYAANCHCADCRRATGSAFKPFAGIEREKMTVIEGEGRLLIFGDEDNHDARCSACGSFLYSVVRDGAFVHIVMGTLTDDPTIRPNEHIFVGSKAPWYTINDDLPQYERHVFEGPPINR